MTCQHSEKGLPWLKAWFMGIFNPENVYLCVGEEHPDFCVFVQSRKGSFILAIGTKYISLVLHLNTVSGCVCGTDIQLATPRHSLRKKCSYHLWRHDAHCRLLTPPIWNTNVNVSWGCIWISPIILRVCEICGWKPHLEIPFSKWLVGIFAQTDRSRLPAAVLADLQWSVNLQTAVLDPSGCIYPPWSSSCEFYFLPEAPA